MSDALLDLPAKRGRLHALAAAGVLDRSELQRALERLGLRPTTKSWSAYLYWHALITGVVLLAAGTIFFVAANWSALGPFVRMGIVGGAMVLATLIGGYLGESLAGRALSLLGGLLFGPLAVVYSQVYQTGADAWELFAWWTVVLVAYGVLIRFVGIWTLALLGLHVAWFLWIDQELGVDPYAGKGALLVPALALVDAVIVALAEWLLGPSREGTTTREREGIMVAREREVITHVAAYFGLGVLLPFGVIVLIDLDADADKLPGLALLVLGLLAIWLVYRWRRPAVGMLAAFAAVVTLLSSVFFGRILFEDLDAELFGVAALGLIICAQVWGFTRWLLRWRREHVEPKSPAPEATP